MRELFRTFATPPLARLLLARGILARGILARGIMARLILSGVTLTGLTLSGLNTALARQSADQIINPLKPAGNLAADSTRGIKPGGAASPQAMAPANPVSAGMPGARSGIRSMTPAPASAPSVDLTVNVSTGSSELSAAARASLDLPGKALASNDLANFRFRIEGHTDNAGANDENMVLSRKRAESVVSYLSSQYNVQPARVESVGMGQERPVVETTPQTPEGKNRRVQVITLGA